MILEVCTHLRSVAVIWDCLVCHRVQDLHFCSYPMLREPTRWNPGFPLELCFFDVSALIPTLVSFDCFQ